MSDSNGVVFGPQTARRVVELLRPSTEKMDPQRPRRSYGEVHWVKVDTSKITTTSGSITAGSNVTVTTGGLTFVIGDKVRVEDEIVTVTTGGTGSFHATFVSNHSSGVSVWLTTSVGHYPGKWYLQDASTLGAPVAQTDIWISPIDGVTLVSATYYLGRVTGNNGNTPVYVVPKSSSIASIPDGTTAGDVLTINDQSHTSTFTSGTLPAGLTLERDVDSGWDNFDGPALTFKRSGFSAAPWRMQLWYDTSSPSSTEIGNIVWYTVGAALALLGNQQKMSWSGTFHAAAITITTPLAVGQGGTGNATGSLDGGSW